MEGLWPSRDTEISNFKYCPRRRDFNPKVFNLKRLYDLTVLRGQQHVYSLISVRCTEVGVEALIFNCS